MRLTVAHIRNKTQSIKNYINKWSLKWFNTEIIMIRIKYK